MTRSGIFSANALWGDKNLTYATSFLNEIKKSKYNNFYKIDYTLNPLTISQIINLWIEKNTQNNISNLLEKTKNYKFLTLSSAFYFRGIWLASLHILDKSEVFNNVDGSMIQVSMMQQHFHYEYSENEYLRMLKLPYGRGELAMAIILPKHNLSEVKEKLSADDFSQLIASAQNKDIMLRMPTFKVESTVDSLPKILSSMRLKSVTDNKEPWLSAGVQKVIIDVNNEGYDVASSLDVGNKPLSYIVNKPFIFLVFDARSKAIVCMGQVLNLN